MTSFGIFCVILILPQDSPLVFLYVRFHYTINHIIKIRILEYAAIPCKYWMFSGRLLMLLWDVYLVYGTFTYPNGTFTYLSFAKLLIICG